MGIFKPRHVVLTVCLLQLISAIQRQVFDFFGFLWIPILINFFEIIFVIFGFFGAFQCRIKYLIWYTISNIIWLGWNTFLICLYLDIGTLQHKESQVLKLDPDSSSWWENGPGCKGVLNTTASVPTWENVTNCLVDYRHVEIFQAGLQCVLASLGIAIGTYFTRILIRNTVHSLQKSQTNAKRRSLYYIEFSQQLERQQLDENSEYDAEQVAASISPKPMTPRRVKRRSVMTRGSLSRHSTSSKRYSHSRSSARNSRRTIQNPVTRLLEQQQIIQGNANSIDHSLIEHLPSYCNTVGTNNNIVHQNWHSNGHSNPTYQQSSMQSLNQPDDVDEWYNNRPASVRSSYSNFHGTRAMSHRSSQHYNNHATPQVPQKNVVNLNKQSMRNTVFLNSGPPAYSSQGQPVNDSETMI